MNRARIWLFRLPTLIGAGLLGFLAFQLAWNKTVASHWPLLAFHLKYPPGFVADDRTPPTWANLLNGAYQHSQATRIGVETIVYRDAVRWKHQLYYSLLGMSGMSTILVGHGKQLIESGYIDEYCRRDPEAMRRVALPWAERIRALQDQFEARGQMFLYIITPSKVALHPDYLPDGYPCPGRAHADEKLAIYRQALHMAGVHFVDGPALMRQALGHYASDVYPRGGIHWDMLGAALGAQAMVAALNDEGAQLSPFTFTVGSTMHVVDWDRDLAVILNLVYPDPYPVPELTYASTPAGPCRRLHITEIAGSFIFQLNDALEHTACPPEIRPYFYWTNLTTSGADGQLHKQPEDPARRRADILDWANVVVLEENEAAGPESEHAQALMQMMHAYEASR